MAVAQRWGSAIRPRGKKNLRKDAYESSQVICADGSTMTCRGLTKSHLGAIRSKPAKYLETIETVFEVEAKAIIQFVSEPD